MPHAFDNERVGRLAEMPLELLVEQVNCVVQLKQFRLVARTKCNVANTAEYQPC